MITVGSIAHGPEIFGSPWFRAKRELSIVITKTASMMCGDWDGNIPGVNVVFHIPGSLQKMLTFSKIESTRLSKKHKLLLVSVPVPSEIIRDYKKSLCFAIGALHQANHLAADAFSKKLKSEKFDLAKAEAIVNYAVKQVRQSRSLAGNAADPLLSGKGPVPLTGFSSKSGWTINQDKARGRPRFVRVNAGARLIQAHPELPFKLTVTIPLLHPNPNGLPSRSESIELEAIENELADVMEPREDGYFVAATSTNGVRELMFYVRGPKNAGRALRAAEKVANGHLIEHAIDEDRNWDAYKKLSQ